MTVLRRTYAELEDALGNALTRIEELESASTEADEKLDEVVGERDGARQGNANLEKRNEALEQALDDVRDALARV